MAIRNVGPNSTYPSIAAAMAASGPGDTILLEAGYGNEMATIAFNGMIVSGGASSTGIALTLGIGVTTFSLAGTAPINVQDSLGGNAILGNGGNNLITVTDGADAVNGGLGVDRLIVDYRLATNAITGDSTSNFDEAGTGRLVTITAGTIEHFTVLTGNGADTITTGAGDDIIYTYGGAGTVTAGQGANFIVGGGGADTITALDGGNYIHGGNGTNVLTSGAGIDTIVSGTGADTIVAGAGNDLIMVRGGADTADADAGNDRLDVNYAAMTTNVTGGITGGNLGTGYVGHIADLVAATLDFSDVENFTIVTGSGNDTIYTGEGIDILSGGMGNDSLSGGGGADTIDGGGGNDLLEGGSGFDILTGGAGDDRFRLGGAFDTVIDTSGRDTIYSTITRSLLDYGAIENLILEGTANINGTGNGLGNGIIGNNFNNTLDGGAGQDALWGMLGTDIYLLGDGDDSIVDTGGTDAIASSINRSLLDYATIENLLLQGSAVTGTGNALDNAIIGNGQGNVLAGLGGVDTLLGMGGNDYLFGQAGRDTLDGGAGDDTFSYQAASDSVAGAASDIVQDFDDFGNDVINLTQVFAGSLEYMGTGAFTGSGQVRINDVAGGAVVVEVNLDIDGAAEMQIYLAATTAGAMAITDFLL